MIPSMLLSRRRFLFLVITSATTTLSACATTMPFTPQAIATPETLTRSDILAAINAIRQANGVPPWAYNERLEHAARSQARLMAQHNTLSHDLGITLRQRVTEAGYRGAVGENLAMGYTDLAGAIQGWMHSPDHRSTLLSSRFVEFGLANARTHSGKYYWAMIAGGSFDAWLS